MPNRWCQPLIALVMGVSAALAWAAGEPPAKGIASVSGLASQDVSAPPARKPSKPKQDDPPGDGFAWTDFSPSPDTRFVFVSASEGSDANSGLSPDAPVASLAEGLALVRTGYPDWLLLRRGDIWTGEDFGKISKAGRSGEEPILISSYGEDGDRPLIRTGTAKRGMFLDGSGGASHIAVAGIELHAHTYDGATGAEAGILWLGPGENLLIEDCVIRGYKDNVVLNGFTGTLTDARVRASVIADSFSTAGHSQGLYADRVDGLTIEGCVFDHNGWNDSVSGAEPTIFNHNLYVQRDCEQATIIGNAFTNAAAHGILLRADATVKDNLYVRNPIAIWAGDSDEPAANPISVAITSNVILLGSDITSDLPRGFGLDLSDLHDSTISMNIIAHDASSQPWGHAIMVHGTDAAPLKNVKITQNTIYDWRGGIKHDPDGIEGVLISENLLQATDSSVPVVKHKGAATDGVTYAKNVYHSEAPPVLWFELGKQLYNFGEWKELTGERGSDTATAAFVAPERTPQTYQASLGEPPTLDDFVAALRDRAKLDWDPRYEIDTILDYFREGFATTNMPTPAPGAVID